MVALVRIAPRLFICSHNMWVKSFVSTQQSHAVEMKAEKI